MYLKLAQAALLRPSVLPDLLRMAWAFRARNWYRRPPFLPIPPRAYMRWRMETAYGDPGTMPPKDEMGRYLRWASQMRERARMERVL